MQIRRLSREFSAKLIPTNRPEKPLRLLASPIYRYPETTAADHYVDGAMFAFVQGTDAEVLLLIEVIENEKDKLSWRYALARMSIVPTQVMLRDELVWQTDWAIQNRATTYFVYKNRSPDDAVITPFH